MIGTGGKQGRSRDDTLITAAPLCLPSPTRLPPAPSAIGRQSSRNNRTQIRSHHRATVDPIIAAKHGQHAEQGAGGYQAPAPRQFWWGLGGWRNAMANGTAAATAALCRARACTAPRGACNGRKATARQQVRPPLCRARGLYRAEAVIQRTKATSVGGAPGPPPLQRPVCGSIAFFRFYRSFSRHSDVRANEKECGHRETDTACGSAVCPPFLKESGR